ncbi:hypothetical protein F5887DRAFT_1291711 [Amanita rubescens]|nr:hypothetical protein F5887DRAFT_1291711 [Amanita rubescens]
MHSGIRNGGPLSSSPNKHACVTANRRTLRHLNAKHLNALRTDVVSSLVHSLDGISLFEKTEYLEVVCDIIHHDGQEFGFSRRIFEIEKYPGTRPIANLPVYPLQYHDNNHGVYSRAVELGKRLVQLPTHCFREIKGRHLVVCNPLPLLSYDSRRVGHGETEPFFVNGRVMISPLAYARFHSTISPTVHHALKDDSLTDDQYAICSPILMGFAFDRKIWGEFGLRHACDVDWDDAAFDALVLSKKQKTPWCASMLKRKPTSTTLSKAKDSDSLDCLLGLRAAVKCWRHVAEGTHKPLYVLSAGELGIITSTSLESTLVRALELAQMWDASATLWCPSSPVDSNTNMLEHCDPGFESRIHFSASHRINGRQQRANGPPPGALLKDIDLVLSVSNDWEKATQKTTRRGPAVDEGDIL